MFAVPWEGCVLLGTTDIDHTKDLSEEPGIHPDEVRYLIAGAKYMFPELTLEIKDAVSSIAGVRPVLSEGKADASHESREHVVWVDKGLVTITGGKLTTFRKLAWDTLKVAKKYIKEDALKGRKEPVFEQVKPGAHDNSGLSALQIKRLYGRYGKLAETLIADSHKEDLTLIPGTYTLWAEISHAARYENVRHLTDLLLRRVRIGILLPDGGQGYTDRIKRLCMPHLSWDEQRWDIEINRYKSHWEQFYKVPEI
jgi:glycerol-3-phosphate dehydrogenase